MPDELLPSELPEPPEPAPAMRPFLIVGVGASAGGLEALGELLRPLPFDDLAMVVVQHLAPTQSSILAQLLSRTTSTPVLTAADGMVVESGHIYVIPPDTDLAILQGRLHLVPLAGPRPHRPIDNFFRSLADDRGALAIGIVLSGTGTDGTLGLEAIKVAGGVTFAQEPTSAKYDGMPRSAIAGGYADFTLTPPQIAEELRRLGEAPRLPLPASVHPSVPPKPRDQLAKLFVLIRSAFGNDWSQYKPSTVERRIDRRMTVHRIAELGDYVKFVASNAEELRALHRDMLITVTSFFRDGEAFDALKRDVLPKILLDRSPNAPVRAWVPACATGEEAYSVAIVLLELVDALAPLLRVQVFGTDVDEDSIQQARRGTYASTISLDVSPERLERFFVKKDGDYVVSRHLREVCTFSKQNVLKDAPFSRLDLVTCRNLLIYLQPAAQRKVLRIAHHALSPSGFLMLGTSETVGDAAELFSFVERKHKIYATKHAVVAPSFDPSPGASRSAGAPLEAAPHVPAGRPMSGLQTLVDRRLVELYGPPGVVVDENLEILLFRGRTGPYLDPSPGAASFGLLRLARPELHADLQKIVRSALADGVPAHAEVVFYEDGQPVDLQLEAVPIQDRERARSCVLVLFEKRPRPKEIPVLGPAVEGREDERVALLVRRNQELERTIGTMKEYLQAAVAEREVTTEEFKSAHEELQSINEELQSTNEELETSKEEMLSSNEELTSLNDELRARMEDLGQSNDDLHNLLAGVDHAVIIVGLDSGMRRYTAAAEKLFSLGKGDVGRPVGFIERFVGPVDVGGMVASAIQALATTEIEILCANRRWYSLRVTPYKTLEHVIRGAVVLLRDIDVAKRAAELTKDVGAYASSFLGAIGHPLLIVDARLRVVWASRAFYETFDLMGDETIGSALTELGDRQWARPPLVARLRETAASGALFRDHVVPYVFPNRARRDLKVSGNRVPMTSDSVLLLLSIEDGTPAAPRAER